MKRLGIDLGTFNSSAAVRMDDGTLVMVQSRFGTGMQGKNFPSFVEFDLAGNVLSIGEPARRQRRFKPRQVVWGVKRLVGLSYSQAQASGELAHFDFLTEPDPENRILIRIGQKVFFPEDILRIILQFIKEDAENPDFNPELAGQRFDNVVISYPAYYNAVRCGYIDAAARGRDGARLFSQVAKIAEPTAAAVRYGLRIDQEAKVMAIDLGAGTLDVSVVTLIKVGDTPDIQEKGVSGHEALGGMDMDRTLLEGLRQDPNFARGRETLSESALLDLIETARIELSSFPETNIAGRAPYRLSQQRMEEILDPLLERIRKPIRIALREASLSASAIDFVALIGGPTRMPCVRRRIADEMKRQGAKPAVIEQILNPPETIDPMECVAQGAALLPETLDTRMPEGFGLLEGDAYERLIPPGTPFPYSQEVPLKTVRTGRLPEVSVEAILEMPDAERESNGVPGYRYASLGRFTLGIDDRKSSAFKVQMRVTETKALSITLTQIETGKQITYEGTNLLILGERTIRRVGLREPGGRPDPPPPQPDLNITYTHRKLETLKREAEHLLARHGSGQQGPSVRRLRELLAQTLPRDGEVSDLGADLNSAIRAVAHELATARVISAAEREEINERLSLIVWNPEH